MTVESNEEYSPYIRPDTKVMSKTKDQLWLGHTNIRRKKIHTMRDVMVWKSIKKISRGRLRKE